jgi:hypothetical protein
VVPFNQTLAGNYRIRITSTSDAAYTGTSDQDFQISAGAPLTVEAPDGGEEWLRGSARTITWRYTGFLVTAVRIELLRGTEVALVITPATPVGAEGSGSYAWTIPPKLKPGSYRIRITSTASSTIADLSNAVFTIRAA